MVWVATASVAWFVAVWSVLWGVVVWVWIGIVVVAAVVWRRFSVCG